MLNGQIYKIHRNISCYFVNVILEKRQVTLPREIRPLNFQGIIFSCDTKNICLKESLFKLNFMLRFNKSYKIETLEKYFSEP